MMVPRCEQGNGGFGLPLNSGKRAADTRNNVFAVIIGP